MLNLEARKFNLPDGFDISPCGDTISRIWCCQEQLYSDRDELAPNNPQLSSDSDDRGPDPPSNPWLQNTKNTLKIG